jgi:hypothetical protein
VVAMKQSTGKCRVDDVNQPRIRRLVAHAERRLQQFLYDSLEDFPLVGLPRLEPQLGPPQYREVRRERFLPCNPNTIRYMPSLYSLEPRLLTPEIMGQHDH